MTLIIGIEQDNKVFLGGDSGVFDNEDGKNIYQDDKVYRKNNFLIGAAGSVRLAQIIRYHFIPPKYRGKDTHRFIINQFVKGLVKCVEKYGKYTFDKDDNINFELLIGYKGMVFSIDSEFGVFRDKYNKYNAIGCGSDVAKGVLHAISKLEKETNKKFDGEYKLKLAFEAASKFSTGVSAPFRFISL